MRKKWLIGLLSAIIVLGLCPAAWAEEDQALLVTGGDAGVDYSRSSEVLTILSGTPLTVSGTTDTGYIVVEAGVTAHLTISDLNIDLRALSMDQGASAIEVSDSAVLYLTLSGTNSLHGSAGHAGIRVPAGASLVVDGGSGDALEVTGGVANTFFGGAGIGSNSNEIAGAIIVNDGMITAKGLGYGGAGIGNGGWLTGLSIDNTIEINGGYVTVLSQGWGDDGPLSASSIEICGGVVETESDALIGWDERVAVTKTEDCIIFMENSGLTYGAARLSQDLTIDESQLLLIPAGASVTGAERITNDGLIVCQGRLEGQTDNRSGTILTVPSEVGDAAGCTCCLCCRISPGSCALCSGDDWCTAGDCSCECRYYCLCDLSLPARSTVQTGGGPAVTLPEGGTVVTLAEGRRGEITLEQGQTAEAARTVLTPPEADGGTLTPVSGGLAVPAGFALRAGEGPLLTIGAGTEGSVLDPGGGLRLPQGGTVMIDSGSETSITVMVLGESGSTVKPLEDGMEVSAGAALLVDGRDVTLGETAGKLSPNGALCCQIHYDSQGGSAVASAAAEVGGKAARPADPTRNGYTFAGWYRDSAGTVLWDFETDTPAGDMTLYAKWIADSAPPEMPDTPDTDVTARPGGGSDSPSVNTPPAYQTTVPRTEHGSVTAVPSRAAAGSTVTLTPVPEEGYVLKTLTVTDSLGRAAELTEKDGAYIFVMPGGGVTVEAVFQPVPKPELPWENPFEDVDEDWWYYDAVRFVSQQGLMSGYGAGRFCPDDLLSRAMLAQILYNKEGTPAVNAGGVFVDFAEDEWYAGAVAWAAEQELISGYGDGSFGPGDGVTREQMAAILWRYAGRPAPPNLLLNFTDAAQASDWAGDALRWAVDKGILSGAGGILDPGGAATRAQAAQMLKCFLELEAPAAAAG